MNARRSGFDGVDGCAHFFVHSLQIAIQIERARVPVGIVVGNLERSDGNARRLLRVAQEGVPAGLTPWFLAGEDHVTGLRPRRGVRPLHRFDLGCGQTVLGIGRFALQHRGVELARTRLVQEAILDTVAAHHMR